MLLLHLLRLHLLPPPRPPPPHHLRLYPCPLLQPPPPPLYHWYISLELSVYCSFCYHWVRSPPLCPSSDFYYDYHYFCYYYYFYSDLYYFVPPYPSPPLSVYLSLPYPSHCSQKPFLFLHLLLSSLEKRKTRKKKLQE